MKNTYNKEIARLDEFRNLGQKGSTGKVFYWDSEVKPFKAKPQPVSELFTPDTEAYKYLERKDKL